MRLARRGFQVLAVDFSETALKKAEAEIRSAGLQDRITLRREDILSLTLGDGSFEYLLCWGVLMHIADLERAIHQQLGKPTPAWRERYPNSFASASQAAESSSAKGTCLPCNLVFSED
jgi:cyclopropane fatty-acyl-phospholipid synthase-like methyltransferase